MNEELTRTNQALAAQIATVAGQNKQLEILTAAQEENFRQSVELCVQTMQTFYPTLGNQARRVFALCTTMAKGIDLSPEQRQTLEISAWIHDIGLVGVPRRLIKRWEESPGVLSAAERALIEHHPILGAELAGFAHHLKEVGPTIRGHHERFDGSGYPGPIERGEYSVAGAVAGRGRRLCRVRSHRPAGGGQDQRRVQLRYSTRRPSGPSSARLPKAVVPGKQREVLLSDLRPGMVLAQGIYTVSGILLYRTGKD